VWVIVDMDAKPPSPAGVAMDKAMAQNECRKWNREQPNRNRFRVYTAATEIQKVNGKGRP
jgi:hypothetical protein